MMPIGCGQFSDDDWMHYVLDGDKNSPLARHCAQCPACAAARHTFDRTTLHVHTALQEDDTTDETFVSAVITDWQQGEKQAASKRFWSWRPIYGSLAAATVLVFLAISSNTLLGPAASLPEQQSRPIHVSSYHAVLEADAPPTGETFTPHGITIMAEEETNTASAPTGRAIVAPHGATAFANR